MANRAEVVLVAAVAGVVALAVVAGVVAANRDGATLDPGSPEAVVQTYLAALTGDDLATAAEQLDPDGDCDLADLAAAYLPPSLGATLEGTTLDDGQAVVTVEVSENWDEGPFGSSGYEHTERLVLEQHAGAWVLVGSPWPLYGCSLEVPK